MIFKNGSSKESISFRVYQADNLGIGIESICPDDFDRDTRKLSMKKLDHLLPIFLPWRFVKLEIERFLWHRALISELGMTNPFADQKRFMQACDQSVGQYNEKQYDLYKNLIKEEFTELMEAPNKVEELDALIDILVVTVGALHSLGADAEGAWNEVMRTNFAKIDPETGKVRKREDGKVLKPAGWTPPDLRPYL
jgi:hypothetical protein